MQPDPQTAMLNKILEELATNTAETKANTAETKKLAQAFPAGDLDGHRRYHESVIEWRELRNRIVREGLIRMAHMGIFAGTGWLAYTAWQAFKITVKQ